MKTRQLRIRRLVLPAIIMCLLLASRPTGAATETSYSRPSADKEMVFDGHVHHDVGLLRNNVTNFDVIGSFPSANTPISWAPSGRWPGADGTDFLWAAGLWVGCLRNGEALVSTGGWASVLRPSAAPADTIYQTHHGAVGGNRFPWPAADDDGDGHQDEDPLNGLDDDGDSFVDEDFAAISQQHYRCTYRDDTSEIQELFPDHVPLGLSIVQSSYQWDEPWITNAIGYEFTITNDGDTTLEDVYLGMFSDFDIGEPADDRAGYWDGLVEASNGELYPVAVAYMRDDPAVEQVEGYQGWVLLGHTTDPTGISAPAQVGVRSYQDFSGMQSYDNGGDPVNDAERYESMSQPDLDGPSSEPADRRVLISSGPFTTLAPGESLTYQVALVAGFDLEDLKTNAAEMVACYQGREFDQGGQPETVHWIPLTESIVPASYGSMLSETVLDGLQITIETNVSAAEGLALIRRESGNLSERIWSGDDFHLGAYLANRIVYNVVDNDPGQGRRIYDLLRESGGSSVILSRLESDLPVMQDLVMDAKPNPFNPSLEIWFVPGREDRVRLQAFDMRGRLVRTLLDEVRSAGENRIIWNGCDDRGRALASGVYQLKLEAGGQLAERQVTLIK